MGRISGDSERLGGQGRQAALVGSQRFGRRSRQLALLLEPVPIPDVQVEELALALRLREVRVEIFRNVEIVVRARALEHDAQPLLGFVIREEADEAGGHGANMRREISLN